MNKQTTIFLILFSVIFPALANAQLQASAITRIVYYSNTEEMFANSIVIKLEITPDGNLRMYSNIYGNDSFSKKMSDLSQRGPVSMSVDDFKKTFIDSLANYYTGKVSRTDYRRMLDLISSMQSDTTWLNNNCCCDIPFRSLKVYSNRRGEQFMECGTTKNNKIASLMNLLDTIAHKKGYQKAKARFSLD